ncbi:MAG: hypothetical protein J7647_22260 [Cyanobacteria bacterium SBLK]|nr:hypothetical protein [Cyanobacteria bacterium SBLK]
MFLSINNFEKRYFFTWHSEKSKFHYEGELLDGFKLFQTLNNWIEIYKTFCNSRFFRGEITRQSQTSRNVEQELIEVFSELVSLLTQWLKNCEAFSQADRDALRNGERHLTLIINPQSNLALMPWEECCLGQDYIISYASRNFSSPGNATKGSGILGILGQMGENDRQILEKYEATILENPNLDTLCQSLRNSGSEVIYYGGHSDGNNLYLGESISSERLRRAVKASAKKGAKFLLANSCNGSGLVWLDLPLSAFIIWKLPVPDAIAHDFAEFFFEAIDGRNYSQAFYEARERLADKNADIPGLRTMVQLWERTNSSSFPSLKKTRRLSMKLIRKIAIGGFVAACTLPFFTYYLNLIAVDIDRKGNVSLASSLYDLVNTLNDNQGGGYYNKASVAEDRGNLEEAIINYQKSADRGSVEAFPSLSRLQLREGNYQQAINTASRCIEVALSQDNPEIWTNNNVSLCYARIAWGYWKLGDLVLADLAIQKGLKYSKWRSDNVAFDLYCIALRVYRDTDKKDLARKFSLKIIESKNEISELKQIKSNCISDARALASIDGSKEHL